MKRILLIGCCLFAAVGAQARLTLDACRALACEHYPEIRQYDLIRQTEAYTLSNARRSYLPQFSLSAQATWQTSVPNFPDVLTGMLDQQGVTIPGLRNDQYKIGLELNQTIWDGGKSAADRRIARAEAAEQLRTTEVDLYALQGRVDDLYFGILLLDERIAQVRLTIDLLGSNFDKVRALQKNGAAMPSDADAVEAELLTVRQQLTQLAATRDSYRRMLGLFIGRELGDESLERPVVAEPVSLEPDRPEQTLFEAKSGLFAAREQLVESSTRPSFGLFAQGYYGYPGLNYMESMLNGNWSWNALIGVRMAWNFGAFYTRKNSLNKLRTAQKSVEVQRDVFLFNVRLQTAEESGNIVRLRKALADDRRIVVLRRQVREAAESKLRNGVIDTNDLLRHITEEAAANVSCSTREIELLKAIYDLKHTVNR